MIFHSIYVDILIDANTNYDEDLTIDKLFGWHYAMSEKGFIKKVEGTTGRGTKYMVNHISLLFRSF